MGIRPSTIRHPLPTQEGDQVASLGRFLGRMDRSPEYSPTNPRAWEMFFDGSKMLHGAGAGVVLVSPRKDEMKYVLQIHFPATNNEAEYEALLYGLRMAISLGIRRLMMFGDSDLVINQVMKEWDIRSPAMTTYCVAVRKLEKIGSRS